MILPIAVPERNCRFRVEQHLGLSRLHSSRAGREGEGDSCPAGGGEAIESGNTIGQGGAAKARQFLCRSATGLWRARCHGLHDALDVGLHVSGARVEKLG